MENDSPIKRRKCNPVKIGGVVIGGGFPIAIQSMTNTDTRDIDATVRQIEALTDAGCEIIRVAVLDDDAAACLGAIKKRIKIPLVADIHFKYKLALAAIAQGVDKIRINPGNIGDDWKVHEIVKAASNAGIPIRVGVNSGSLPKDLVAKHGHDNPGAFVEAALRQVAVLEEKNFKNIVVALKSSNVNVAHQAHLLLADKIDYPFHLGITEAGTRRSGIIKSAVGIGAMLINGIGDTVRVSLSADPIEEIYAARMILRSLELRREGVEIISCPTCGRTEIDLISLAESIEQKTAHYKTPLKVAVMGCSVNGPGEAAAADVGIAGGRGLGLLFRKGKIIRKIPENELEQTLLAEIENLTGGK